MAKDDDIVNVKDKLRYLGEMRSSNTRTYMYSFVVYDFESKTTVDECPLYLSPQSIQVTEPAATTITALQNGGKYLERRGNIFKDITIAGTTGYMPYKRAHAVFSGLDQFDMRFRYDDDEDVAKKLYEESGFARFHALRNFFRKYQNTLRTASADETAKLRMLWFNYKDDEFWVVEPLLFTLVRDRAKPLSYDYHMQLRYVESAASVFRRKYTDKPGVNSILQKGMSAIAKVQSAINKLKRFIALGREIVRTAVSAVKAAIRAAIGLVSSVVSALEGFVAGVTEAILAPVSIVKDAALACTEVLVTCATTGFQLAVDQVNTITDAIQTAHNIAAEPALFTSSFAKSMGTALDRFNTAAGIRGKPQEAEVLKAFSGKMSTRQEILR